MTMRIWRSLQRTLELPRTSRFAMLAIAPFALFVWASRAFLRYEAPFELRFPWVPWLGVEVGFHVDALALFFLLLITGVGTCVFVYAAGYLGEDPKRRRLFSWLVVFMAAMIGAVAADDLFVLYTFWELTSLASFMLVSYHHESETARRSGRQAMLVTFGGGFVLLLGFLVLAGLAGTSSIQGVIAAAPRFAGEPAARFAMFCLFVGAFTKSAQIPFHFWLPDAMAAPTPVSAYLHSATMVKLGVYLLARIEHVFADDWLFGPTLIVVGGTTSAWAMVKTLRERDIKRILAWATVSALGTMMMLIGLPGAEGAMALVAFVLAHALYKAPLFFVAGNVDHCTGTRDIGQLAALARVMPWTAAAALAAALSMGGFPLSFGHFAKELIHIAKRDGDLYTIIGYGSIPVSAITVAVAAIAAVRIFWHRGDGSIPSEMHEAPFSMRIPPLALASLGVLLGLSPHVVDPMLQAAAKCITPDAHLVEIDETRELLGLVPVYALGVIVFASWDRLHEVVAKVKLPSFLLAKTHLEKSQETAVHLASIVTRTIQHGRLRGYAALLFSTMLAALALTLAATLEDGRTLVAHARLGEIDGARIAVLGACVLLVVSAIAMTVLRDTFVLLLVSGLMGLGVALSFLFAGAPDLALTQFIVEVALVVVIASVLLRVRRLGIEHPPTPASPSRLALSLGLGAAVALAIVAASGTGTASTALAEYFGAHSLPDAHGRNVVNVLLVDFRALDTLGEITVLSLAFFATARVFAAFRREEAGR